MNLFQKLKMLFRSKAFIKHRYPNDANPDDPLSRDEVQRLFNSLSTIPVPSDLAQSLATRKITFTTPESFIDHSQLINRGDIPNTWNIQLPQNAKIGISVRNVHKLDYDKIAKQLEGVEAAKAFLPEWTKSLQIARPFAKPEIESITSFDGTAVKPTVGIYGADDRSEIYPDSYPFYLVGRLDVYINGNWVWYGSAALVGPRHIATAGHMVPWASDNWQAIFTPGYHDGESVLGPGANSWVTDATGWNTNDRPAAHDLAVLRLETDRGNWLGHFGAKTFRSKWLYNPFFWLIGYPYDRSNGGRPYFQTPVPFTGMDSEKQAIEIQHRADMTEGQSGGPLWGQWSDGPYIVGVQSGGKDKHDTFLGLFDYDYNLAAGGNSLLNLIHWAKANWP